MHERPADKLRARVEAMSPHERRAFWNRLLRALDKDVLDGDYPMELVDEELRAYGIDPEEAARKFQATAEAALAKAKGRDDGE